MRTVPNGATAGQPAETDTTGEQDLLRAIREALEVPYPASYKDSEARTDLIKDRVTRVQGILDAVMEGATAASAARTLRGMTQSLPATYEVDRENREAVAS